MVARNTHTHIAQTGHSSTKWSFSFWINKIGQTIKSTENKNKRQQNINETLSSLCVLLMVMRLLESGNAVAPIDGYLKLIEFVCVLGSIFSSSFFRLLLLWPFWVNEIISIHRFHSPKTNVCVRFMLNTVLIVMHNGSSSVRWHSCCAPSKRRQK